jgi:hypothetical protein
MKDYNAFVGKWPFYELPREGVEQLRELHAKNGVYGGYVSSVESIFYNDCYESEQKLSAKLRGAEYGHVISPNPALAECGVTLERALSDFDVKGIRLHPEYHGYRLTDPAVSVVTDAAPEAAHEIRIGRTVRDEAATMPTTETYGITVGDGHVQICAEAPYVLLAGCGALAAGDVSADEKEFRIEDGAELLTTVDTTELQAMTFNILCDLERREGDRFR